MNGAFSRSIALRAQILSILALGGSSFATQQMIAGLGEYESRGHGGRYKPNRSRPAFGRSGWPSGKYKPDDGICKSEARATGAPLVSTPRPMWHVVQTHPHNGVDFSVSDGFSKRRDAIEWAHRFFPHYSTISIQLH